MKQRDHQGAANELFESMKDGNEKRRKRRQADFSDDYGSDVYGYGRMNRQFDSPNDFEEDGERRGPPSFGFNGQQPGQRQGPLQQFGPFGRPRHGPSFGPGNDDDQRQGLDGRRGRQGPPPSFGPGDEGHRGPFGPRQDEQQVMMMIKDKVQ
uniref:Uncharacterized protein n=1 Tax=Panagrolaimus superbus TaxID=310955 RepID=A0A914Y4G5_9BILA